MKCQRCDHINSNDSLYCMKCGANLKHQETNELEAIRKALGGKYRVTSILGSGNVGCVYHAIDETINRDVAIKILHEKFAKDSGFTKRFKREMSILAAIDHKNIVPIYTAGSIGERPYYVMKYIKGQSLGEILRKKGKVPEIDAIRYARAICGILIHAHDSGVVHRDLKPENIMLMDDKSKISDSLCIMDFGIAKITKRGDDSHPASATITAEDTWTGTPNYMSPEQCRAERDIDGRSDLYSLGVIIYEMLTGHLPFSSGTITEVIASHLKDKPKSLRSLNSSISPETESAVLLLLRKDRNKRPDNGCVLDLILKQIEKILIDREKKDITEGRTVSDSSAAQNVETPNIPIETGKRSKGTAGNLYSSILEKIKSINIKWAVIGGSVSLALAAAALATSFSPGSDCEYKAFANHLLQLEKSIKRSYKSINWENQRHVWINDVNNSSNIRNIQLLIKLIIHFERAIIQDSFYRRWHVTNDNRSRWENSLYNTYTISQLSNLLIELGENIKPDSAFVQDFNYGNWKQSLSSLHYTLRSQGK